jgi:hypothetical protein
MRLPVRYAVITALLLLTRLAAAEEALDQRYVPDRPLGAGLCKTVYSVKGRSDVVIAIAKPLFGGTMEREIKGLETLRKSGVPTVKVHAAGRTADGSRAMVMTRYAAGSKDPAVWSYLNQRSLNDMKRISGLLRKNRLHVDDVQYLIKRDGSMVLADPLKIKKRWLRRPGQQVGAIAKPAGRGFLSFKQVQARFARPRRLAGRPGPGSAARR